MVCVCVCERACVHACVRAPVCVCAAETRYGTGRGTTIRGPRVNRMPVG